MKKELVPIIIIVILLLSCTIERNSGNQTYLKDKLYFPNEFVDHFPTILKSYPSSVNSRYHLRGGSNTQFELISKLDTNNMNQIDSLISISIAKYTSTDTCLNIVNRKYSLRNRFSSNIHLSKKEKLRFHIHCIIENYPVPNFYENKYLDLELKNRLSPDFKLFVLESKSGKYWNEKHWSKGLQMSDQWKNGYSKGIALSKEKSIVIYWFIIW